MGRQLIDVVMLFWCSKVTPEELQTDERSGLSDKWNEAVRALRFSQRIRH